jgi:short-subunit dehydrogenase
LLFHIIIGETITHLLMISSSNKKVVIVGASSGIGKELTRLYAFAGCHLAITGRRNTLLDELKSKYPEHIITVPFDVMGNENIFHLENMIKKMGGMDLFIYNAGYGDISKDLDWNIDKTTVLTNVNGFAEMTNYAFNYFVKQGHGQIVGTSSIASLAGNPAAPAYSASKAFMSIYLEGLYMKARKMSLPIAITDIQPGFIKTKMAKLEGRFWEAPVEKASQQIYHAIEAKRFRVYITKRWWLIANLLKLLPGWLYRRLG